MNQRFYSLDVLRGATVALMILVNNPGSWAYLYAPLTHAPWHGCTLTDLVFPFFLFSVGNSLAFVFPKFRQNKPDFFWKKTIKRTVLIFVIGFLLNWFPFIRYNSNHELVWKFFENVRIMGVLQRISLSYFFASSILYLFKEKKSIIFGMVILLLYWLVAFLGNPTDPYSLQGWFGTKIDLLILGEKKMYQGEGIPFDPEGLMPVFSSSVQVMIGYFAGHFLVVKPISITRILKLGTFGASLLGLGLLWSEFFPLNKKIWSSSYVIYTSGWAMLGLAFLIYSIEIRKIGTIMFRFFDVFGKNPLFIFVLSGATVRFLNLIQFPKNATQFYTPLMWIFENISQKLFSETKMASLFSASLFVVVLWAVAFILDKRKIYVRV